MAWPYLRMSPVGTGNNLLGLYPGRKGVGRMPRDSRRGLGQAGLQVLTRTLFLNPNSESALRRLECHLALLTPLAGTCH